MSRWEGRYTPPISTLPLYVLCEQHSGLAEGVRSTLASHQILHGASSAHHQSPTQPIMAEISTSSPLLLITFFLVWYNSTRKSYVVYECETSAQGNFFVDSVRTFLSLCKKYLPTVNFWLSLSSLMYLVIHTTIFDYDKSITLRVP